MIDSSKDIISKWLKGIPYEVAFWNNVYRWNATFKGMMGWANYGSTISLEDFDANRFLLQKEHPERYKHLFPHRKFDFIAKDDRESTYTLAFRLIKILLPNGTY